MPALKRSVFMLIYLVEDDQSILELEEYALQAQGV